ncbi:fungal-specific transcription factor domain-containing protein [Pyronema omphalodes]|nr:fungal-specific transcription factor domain-containing protein [Pyronema omphalodes]
MSEIPTRFNNEQIYIVTTESRHRTMSHTPTSLSMMETPPTTSIQPPIGEDPRHHRLPGPEVLQMLLACYFEHVFSQAYAFLHQKTFMDNLNSHPPVLLFSMCAVSARFSPFKSQEEEWALYTRELIRDNYDNYCPEVVQSMVHMGLHDFGSNNGHRAWMFAGMAVRMGSALNMNLENRKKDKERNAIAKECIRRTYWSYYLMDRFNSYGVARPFLVQDHDCHIQLPCNQPSFTKGEYVITEHLLGPNPYHPKQGSKYMGAMAFLVRIVGIWGNILRQIHLSGFQVYTPRKEAIGTEFLDFVEKLEDWRRTLPTGLEYSNENLAGQIKVGTTGAFVMMHVMWHTAMAYVHRYVRTVGIPKDYISKNIHPQQIVESIRKAFVHADAVLQIMCHVHQRKQEARLNNEKPVIVNAPFLGQAISDACHITAIRALEVSDPSGSLEQRRRLDIGLAWLKELKQYWKPIEGMYKKLKKTIRNLSRSINQLPNMIPTPDSSHCFENNLQPGVQYAVDPTNYTAELSYSTVGLGVGNDHFAQFTDYLSFGHLPMQLFNEAFVSNNSQNYLNVYASQEAGFPELYPYTTSEATMMTVPVDYNTSMGLEVVESLMSSNDNDNDTYKGDVEMVSDNEDLSLLGKSKSHAVYFDAGAIRDGNLQDAGSSDITSASGGYSRRAGEVVNLRHENPMDVLNLINRNDVNLGLQRQRGIRSLTDKFTGPKGVVAPETTKIGGPLNEDNFTV